MLPVYVLVRQSAARRGFIEHVIEDKGGLGRESIVAGSWQTRRKRKKRKERRVRTIPPIDPPDHLLDPLFQIPMRFQIISARNHDLHERRLTDPRWKFLEQTLERQEFLRQAFDTVEAVYTDDDCLAAEVFFDATDRVLDGRLPQSRVEFCGLDADGENLDGNGSGVVGQGGIVEMLIPVHIVSHLHSADYRRQK